MNRNLWVVTVISLISVSWATAFFGAGATGVVSSADATGNRFSLIEPDARLTTNLFAMLDEMESARASSD